MALTKEDLQAISTLFKQELKKELSQELAPINERLAKIDERLTKIEVVQENVTNKNIQLLLESQQDTNLRLDELNQKVDEMAPTVKALDILHQLQKQVTN